jgi:hypothetical protein
MPMMSRFPLTLRPVASPGSAFAYKWKGSWKKG